MAVVTSLKAQADNRRALQQATANLSAVMRAAGLGARSSLNLIGVGIVSEVKQEVSKQGRGVVYGRRRHRASAPGDPPAVDTGRYRASWTYVIQGGPSGLVGGGAPSLFVGTPAKHGGFLEFGTRRMAPRPHLRPVIRRFEARIPAIVAVEVSKAQRGAVSGLGRALGVRLSP